MAKPPKDPAGEKAVSSDIHGVHGDRKPVNTPENSDPALGRRLQQEEDDNRARPKPSRS
ncbi:hypothetical protein [Sphingomonas sp. DBB INV C78]|uniref:hypothetical protein n=1 Tax=Sphingomonas sp. DBB INV C78 TaxID=3349434 RepID=UPI0036D229AD